MCSGICIVLNHVVTHAATYPVGACQDEARMACQTHVTCRLHRNQYGVVHEVVQYISASMIVLMRVLPTALTRTSSCLLTYQRASGHHLSSQTGQSTCKAVRTSRQVHNCLKKRTY